MPARRILTHGPENEALWVRLYVQEIGGTWAALIVADEWAAATRQVAKATQVPYAMAGPPT